MSVHTTEQTSAALQQHMTAVAQGDLDTITAHYTEDAVLILPDQILHGLAQVHDFFTQFLATMPADWVASFKLIRQDVQGEVAHIFWQAPPTIPLATATFVIRNGKIVAQTFAMLALVA